MPTRSRLSCFFLLSRHKQFQSFFTQHDLFFDRVVSDYSLDKDRIFATQNLNEDELAMYDKVSAVLKRIALGPIT
jgi:deoxyguanosine kinase